MVNSCAADGQASPAPTVALAILEKKYKDFDTYIQASMDSWNGENK